MTAITTLSEALRHLHSALVEHGRREHERIHGPIGGPGQLLHLLANDDSFAWLRPLTEITADIDLVGGEEPTSETQAAIRAEVSKLVTPSSDNVFASRCIERLQDSAIALAHGEVKRALAALANDAIENLHAAHQWNEIRAHRRSNGRNT